MFFWGIILFSFGLAVGSFLNVVACRYQEDRFLFSRKNISGRSHCPHCLKKLSWYELVPLVSFFCQLGMCRGCTRKISWQYPIVEFLTGLVFLLPLYFYNYFVIAHHALLGDLLVWYYWLSGLWVIAGALLILLAAIDWRTYIIPDEIIIGLGLLGLLAAALKTYYQDLIGDWQTSFLSHYALLLDFGLGIFTSHLLAALITFVFFGLIFSATKGRGMGFGDVKLAAVLGLLIGWPDIGVAIIVSFVIGSLTSVLLLIGRRKKMKEALPFGPYLVTGTFVTLFWGMKLLEIYFSFFGIV